MCTVRNLLLGIVIQMACLTDARAQSALSDFVDIDLLAPQAIGPARNVGAAVAVRGDLAVVGAPSESVSGWILHGAAYVFTRIDGRWTQRARLAPQDGEPSLGFGSAVAISSDGQILVGASGYSDGPFNERHGAVYVYAGSGSSWSEVQRVSGLDHGVKGLGFALAVHGSRVLAGAPTSNAALLFESNAGSWSLLQHLSAGVDAASDGAGRSVALNEAVAVLGAPFHGTHDTGAAFVFEPTGGVWSQTVVLAPETTPSAYAGWAVATDGTRIVMGAPGARNSDTVRVGRVRVHVRDTGSWRQDQAFSGSNEANAEFGKALALDGSRLVIAEPNATIDADRSGILWRSRLQPGGFAAPLPSGEHRLFGALAQALALDGDDLLAGLPFERVGGQHSYGRVVLLAPQGDEWRVSGSLEIRSGDSTQRFGAVLALSGTRAAVARPWASVDGQAERGDVAILDFDGSRWQRVATVVDPAGQAGDRFGSSLALDGDRLAVGAPWRDNSGVPDAGSALLFEFDGDEWALAYRYDNAFASGDRLGTAVAIRADRAAVGAPWSEYGGLTNSGLTVVLERGGGQWVPVALLPGGSAQERAGSSLALTDSSVISGAPNANSAAGRVRVYRRLAGNWSQLTSVAAPTGAAGFGAAVAADADLFAIGAPNGDSGAGRIAVYREGVSSVSAESLPSVTGSPRALGTAVALRDGWLLAGALNNGSAPATLRAYRRAPAGVWQDAGIRSSPDGASVIADGFGQALALDLPHVMIGEQWRAQDEGRVRAAIAPAAAQITAVATSPARPVTGQAFIASAEANLGGQPVDGQIRFTLSEGSSCTATLVAGLAQCSLHSPRAGLQTLQADYLPADPRTQPASALSGIEIDPAASALTVLATPSQPHPGQMIQVHATLTVLAPGAGEPTGEISLREESAVGPELCRVPASAAQCEVSAPMPGTLQLVAVYAGDANFTGSASQPTSLNVVPWPTQIQIEALTPSPGLVDQPLQADIRVLADPEAGAPTGRVRLSADGEAGSWVDLDAAGRAQPTALPPVGGLIQLLVEFDGNGGAFADASLSAVHSIERIASSVELGLVPDQGVVAGESVVISAEAVLADGSSASGDIAVYLDSANGAPLCILAAPQGSCDWTVPHGGVLVLMAAYAGDARAEPSHVQFELTALPRPSVLTLGTTVPALPRVGQTLNLQAMISADWEQPQGSIRFDLGGVECSATVSVTGFASCSLVPDLRGDRQLQVDFVPGDGRHAPASISTLLPVQGRSSSISLSPSRPAPYTVGEQLSWLVEVEGEAGLVPLGASVSLRRTGPDGELLCGGAPPTLLCTFPLEEAGALPLYAEFEGDAVFEPSTRTQTIRVEPRSTELIWLGTLPEPVVLGQPWDIVIDAQAGDGVNPPGLLTVYEDGIAVCADLPRGLGGVFVCPRPAPASTQTRYVHAEFFSADVNATDAVMPQRAVVVVEAVVGVRVDLDNGGDVYVPGETLSYVLQLSNQSPSETADLVLDMAVPDGLQAMHWHCQSATAGTECPQPAVGSGALGVAGLLPPGAQVVYNVTADVVSDPPAQIEALARADLLRQVNDDPGLLAGVDLDFRADGRLHADGFESSGAEGLSTSEQPRR